MTSWSGFCLTPMTTSGWRLIPGTPLSPGSDPARTAQIWPPYPPSASERRASRVLGRLYQENLSFNEAVRAGLFTIPCDGCIDYAPILDFVRDSDYRGWLIIEAEQDPAMAPPLATASRAYARLAHHLSSPSSSEEYAS